MLVNNFELKVNLISMQLQHLFRSQNSLLSNWKLHSDQFSLLNFQNRTKDSKVSNMSKSVL